MDLMAKSGCYRDKYTLLELLIRGADHARNPKMHIGSTGFREKSGRGPTLTRCNGMRMISKISDKGVT